VLFSWRKIELSSQPYRFTATLKGYVSNMSMSCNLTRRASVNFLRPIQKHVSRLSVQIPASLSKLTVTPVSNLHIDRTSVVDSSHSSMPAIHPQIVQVVKRNKRRFIGKR